MGGPVSADVTKELEEADRKYEEGRKALNADDFDKAIELFGAVLETRNKVYGELAPECASAYYKYGTALFYKAQAESDAFASIDNTTLSKDGNAALDKIAEEEDVAEEAEEEGAKIEAEAGEHEKINATGDKEECEEEAEGEDEEEGDLELAWKLLETAKLIYQRQGHSVEEVDVIIALADISLEQEQFEASLKDYETALEILEGLVPQDDRMLAELLFKICLAYQMARKPDDSISFCKRAMAVCEARLQRLKGLTSDSSVDSKKKGKEKADEEVAPSTETAESNKEPPTGQEANVTAPNEKEIEEIESLLVGLKEKEEDLLQQVAAPTLKDALDKAFPEVLVEVRSFFSSAAGSGGDSSAAPAAEQALPEAGGGSSSSAASTVKNLGVVGRGVKRTAPVAVVSAGPSAEISKEEGQQEAKKQTAES